MKICAAIFTALMLLVPACGQIGGEALEQLRQHLGLPASEVVGMGTDLPSASPLGVYVYESIDPATRSVIVKRIQSLSQKNGMRYRTVNVVSRPADANLLIVRFEGDPVARTVNVPFAHVGGSSPSGSTHTFQSVPVYSYIVARIRQAHSVLWSGSEWNPSANPEVGGQKIVRELAKLVRLRKT